MLTKAEKAAGRWFRAVRQAALDHLNQESPPWARCSPHSPPFFRHVCKGGEGTVAMRLRDKPSLSPEYAVYHDEKVRLRAIAQPEYEYVQHGPLLFTVPAGKFAFTYLEGTCPKCGFSVRSGTGLFTVVEESESG